MSCDLSYVVHEKSHGTVYSMRAYHACVRMPTCIATAELSAVRVKVGPALPRVPWGPERAQHLRGRPPHFAPRAPLRHVGLIKNLHTQTICGEYVLSIRGGAAVCFTLMLRVGSTLMILTVEMTPNKSNDSAS